MVKLVHCTVKNLVISSKPFLGWRNKRSARSIRQEIIKEVWFGN